MYYMIWDLILRFLCMFTKKCLASWAEIKRAVTCQKISLHGKKPFLPVDGRNPALVEVGNLSQYLQGFIDPRWLAGFLPSTVPTQTYHFLCGIFLTPSRLLPSSIEFSCFIFSQSVLFLLFSFFVFLRDTPGFFKSKNLDIFFWEFYRFGFWVDDVPNFPFGGGICDRFLEGTYSILSEFLRKSKVNKLYLEPHLTHHFFLGC